MSRQEILGTAIVLLFIISLRFANLFFIWFAILLLLMIYGSKWSLKYMQKNLNGEVRFHTHRLFPGEEVTGEVILENRGIIPLFGIQVEFDFWKVMPIESHYFATYQKSLKSNLLSYRGHFNIGKKQRLTIPFTVTGHRRGAYSFRELVVVMGDPLGLEQAEKRISIHQELLVYPTESNLQGIEETHRIPQGVTVVRRWIQDDIFFPVGARPYQTGDPFNRIDFKATAKLQKLHTKKFDFTAHGDICLIANLLTSSYKWNFDEEHFERTLSLVARLARESMQMDLRFSFFANAQAGKGMRVFEILSGSGRNHFRRILEVLARFSIIHVTPISLALSTVRQRYPNGALAVVITSYLDDEMIKELNILVKQGFAVYVVDSAAEIPRIERWSISSWKERSVHIG